jgi:hypothetical protein
MGAFRRTEEQRSLDLEQADRPAVRRQRVGLVMRPNAVRHDFVTARNAPHR